MARWKAPAAPGKFQVVIDGKTLDTVFGTEGADWHWQSGGAIEIKNKSVKISLHDRPVLGGNNSSEARVHIGGGINLPPYPKLGNIVKEIEPSKQGNAQPPETYEDEKKINAVKAEKNISIFINTHAVKAEKSGNNISAVIGRDISVTHVALGTVRVMRTTGMMGEVVGMAAAVCKKHGCPPRAVYERHLDDLVAMMRL